MDTLEMLKILRRPMLGAIIRVMRIVNYGKGQKELKKIVLQPNKTSTRHPNYDQAYAKKLTFAFQDNSTDAMKPSLLLLFVQKDEKSLEVSTCFRKSSVLTTFGKKSMRKVHSESKLTSNRAVVQIVSFGSQFK